jgi:hypothetical protein
LAQNTSDWTFATIFPLSIYSTPNKMPLALLDSTIALGHFANATSCKQLDRHANDIRFFKGWLLRQPTFQKPYLEGEAEGEADPEGEAGVSDPPPQAPRVVAIPRIRTVAKTLIFIVLNSSLQQT